METVSIGIQNLCAPCGCACKYCLLQSCKKATEGIDYFRGKQFAERFVEWGKGKQLAQLPYYYIPYCAEYPELLDNIAFNHSIGFVGASFLQCNGIKIRNESEIDKWISQLKDAGVKNIDITFFGNEKYHDQFAARKGDYHFMMQLVKSANKKGMVCTPSLVITEENKEMLEELIEVLSELTPLKNIHSFLPDYRGRGYLLEDSRLTDKSYAALPEVVKGTLNIKRYQTERSWLTHQELPEYTKRELVITLRKDNIDRFEQMSCDEVITSIEKLDEDYYDAIPNINELARKYGDKNNTKLYRQRDLFWMWQKRYIKEHNFHLYDVTDERFCNTVRS